MRAQAKEQTDVLETALSNPLGREFDFIMDGARGSSQRAYQQRIMLRGGAFSAQVGEIPLLVAALAEARIELRIAEARIILAIIPELKHRIPALETRIAQLTALLEAGGGRVEKDERGKVRVVGGWVDADMRALERAVGRAEFELREACGRVDPYREQWPPIRDFEKKFAVELHEAALAKAALKKAIEARDALLAVLDADRAELLKLKTRRVA